MKGEGTYGQVAKAIDLRTGRVVAIKRIADVFSSVYHSKQTLREIMLLRILKHSGVSRLVEVFVDPIEQETFKDLYIVLEYCQTDLKKMMKIGQKLKLSDIKYIVYNLLTTL